MSQIYIKRNLNNNTCYFVEEVVDCPEFLVHFPTLIKLAEKFGLQLICRERFEDFFDRMLASGK